MPYNAWKSLRKTRRIHAMNRREHRLEEQFPDERPFSTRHPLVTAAVGPIVFTFKTEKIKAWLFGIGHLTVTGAFHFSSHWNQSLPAVNVYFGAPVPVKHENRKAFRVFTERKSPVLLDLGITPRKSRPRARLTSRRIPGHTQWLMRRIKARHSRRVRPCIRMTRNYGWQNS